MRILRSWHGDLLPHPEPKRPLLFHAHLMLEQKERGFYRLPRGSIRCPLQRPFAETCAPSSPRRARRRLRRGIPRQCVRARFFFACIGCSAPEAISAIIASISDWRRSVRNTQYFHISSSEMLMSLPYISEGGSLIPMALFSDFDIFCTPSRPSRIGVIRMICGFCP